MGRFFDSMDTLSLSIIPQNETPQEIFDRSQREAEARAVSQRIDEQIKAEKLALRKKKPIKILLLGQSESGKSTTIKNFQLKYAHQAWLEERASWRAVIQLNLIRSVNTVLDILGDELAFLSPENEQDDSSSQQQVALLTEAHILLRRRLGPLRQIQRDLEALLGSGSQDPDDLSQPQNINTREISIRHARGASIRAPQEPCVLSNCGWKSTLDKLRSEVAAENPSLRRTHSFAKYTQLSSAEEIIDVIVGCKADIKAMWGDAIVQKVLRKRGIRMEHSPGFFLNDVDRIADTNYEPSDDDVVRARLRTMGVQEYRFSLEHNELVREWILYDVAGIRTSRASWVPFFDDVDSILFIAPISCFDEPLAEDKRVNRLQDSLLLWKAIFSNKLLSKAQIILFLNKCDLLASKLARVKVKDHQPDFKDKNNDFKAVSTFFLGAFQKIAKRQSPGRHFFWHLTSVVDTKATAKTIADVKDGIVHAHLENVGLI